MGMFYFVILLIGMMVFLMGTHYLLWRVGIVRGRKADQMWGKASHGASMTSRYSVINDEDDEDEPREWTPWP